VAKMRHAYQVLIIVSLLVGLDMRPLDAVALKPEEPSNRVAQLDSARTDRRSFQDIPDAFSLVGENALFQLFADETTLAFKVVDKRSGYVWHSNLDEVTEDDELNKTWTAFARSGVSIDYLDQKAILRRASITNADHSLEVKPIDQGLEATLTFTEPSITLDVVVRLEENGVSVEVPFDSIKEEDPDSKLGLLHLYPFLGATKEDTVPVTCSFPMDPEA